MESEKKQVLEILLMSHKNRFKTMTSFEDRYHNKFNFIFLYISIIGIVGTVINSLGLDMQSDFISLIPPFIIFIIISFIIFMLFFLVSLMMSDLYMIYMNSIGMKIIEEEINKIIGIDLLIWNSKIFLPRIYNTKKFGEKDWIKPNILVGIFTILISFSVLILFGFICKQFAILYYDPYKYSVLFISLILLHQWWRLHVIGIKYLEKEIFFSETTKKRISKIL